MTVEKLLKEALLKLGISDPEAENLESALTSLNEALEEFTFWDDSINPITEYTALSTSVELPYRYISALKNYVAGKEAPSYGKNGDKFIAMALSQSAALDYPVGGSLVLTPTHTEVD